MVKKPRKERPVTENSSGYVHSIMQWTVNCYNINRAYADDESSKVTCNTEKDRHIRLNLRTAGNNNYTYYGLLLCPSPGILAGLRPCGVIVFLNELFTSESKTQVYGCLHNYYHKYPITANNIGKEHVHTQGFI